MLSPDGKVSDSHGMDDIGDAKSLVGKTMAEARKLVIKEFEARGHFEGAKPHRHSVKHSDRSKAVIEPYLSDQWFVKVTDERLAGSANAALVESQNNKAASSAAMLGAGAVARSTRLYAKTYEQWHDNIRDWCISRQLWWGRQFRYDTRVPGENPRTSCRSARTRSTVTGRFQNDPPCRTNLRGQMPRSSVHRLSSPRHLLMTCRSRLSSSTSPANTPSSQETSPIWFGNSSRKASPKTPTSSTPGSPPPSGRSPRSAGPIPPPSTPSRTQTCSRCSTRRAFWYRREIITSRGWYQLLHRRGSCNVPSATCLHPR